MRLPFTVEQFFDVFERYNLGVWPVQVAFLALAVVALVLVIWPRPLSGVLVSAILAALWAWLGVVYHGLYFSRINPVAFGFGVLSVFGAFAFLWHGVFRRQVRFARPAGWRAWAGGLLVGYSLLVYPLVSWAVGHSYWRSPTFGVPCPTAIFTLGILAFLVAPYPRILFAVPVLWSAIGSQAAILLSVPQDLGLFVAGGVGILLAKASRSPASQHPEAGTRP